MRNNRRFHIGYSLSLMFALWSSDRLRRSSANRGGFRQEVGQSSVAIRDESVSRIA